MTNLKALERQTGLYGTVNAGDTVTFSDEKATELLETGNWVKVSDDEIAETATPEQEVQRNNSGDITEPVHKDATEAEIRNDEARQLSEPLPSEIADEKTDSQKEVIEEVQEKEQAAANAEQTAEQKAEALKEGEDVAKQKIETQKAVETAQKENKAAAGRQTKEDKGAAAAQTK